MPRFRVRVYFEAEQKEHPLPEAFSERQNLSERLLLPD
jgi:hypothetical protein